MDAHSRARPPVAARRKTGRLPGNALAAGLAVGLCAALAAGLGAGAASARPLDEIQHTHRFDVCVLDDNLPFSSEPHAGQPQAGVLADLGGLVAQRLGVELQLTWLLSEEYAAKTGCDALPATAAIAESDSILRTAPWLGVRTVVVVPQRHKPITRLGNLKGDRVGVLAESWARHLLNQAGLTTRVHYVENDEILDAVASGEVEAGIVPLLAWQWWAHQHPGNTLRAEEGFQIDPSMDYNVAFGLRHADAQTLAQVSSILQGLIADGEIAALFERYGLRYQPPLALAAPGPVAAPVSASVPAPSSNSTPMH